MCMCARVSERDRETQRDRVNDVEAETQGRGREMSDGAVQHTERERER